jgi:hypothetical protein
LISGSVSPNLEITPLGFEEVPPVEGVNAKARRPSIEAPGVYLVRVRIISGYILLRKTPRPLK